MDVMTRKKTGPKPAPARKPVKKPKPGKKPEPGPKKIRRTQAERSAATRARLIETAIRCLHKFGYAATTTVLVAEEAGISRGAMLHQFAAKVDLMLAVVEFSYQDQLGHYAERLAAGKNPRRLLHELLDVSWEVMREPSSMAFYEIWLATRSDAELAERFGPVYDRIQKQSLTQMERLMAAAGISGNRKTIEAFTRLHVAALRGLAIERTMERNPERLEGCIDLLRDYTDGFVERHRKG